MLSRDDLKAIKVELTDEIRSMGVEGRKIQAKGVACINAESQ